MANADSSHPHLHHQYYSVECNQHHDEILKLGRNDQLPYFILDGQSILWHEATQWLGVDRKVYALFLKQRRKVVGQQTHENTSPLILQGPALQCCCDAGY